MALIPDGQKPAISETALQARFMIAQDSKPSLEQLAVQRRLRESISAVAFLANERIADSRTKSLGLTALEEALMWLGKAAFEQPAP